MFLTEFTKLNATASDSRKNEVIKRLLAYLTKVYGGVSNWNEGGITKTDRFVFSLGRGVDAKGTGEKYNDDRLVVTQRNSDSNPYKDEYTRKSKIKTLCFYVSDDNRIKAYLDAEDHDLLNDTPIKSWPMSVIKSENEQVFASISDYIDKFFSDDNSELEAQIKATRDLYSQSDWERYDKEADARWNWETAPRWRKSDEADLQRTMARVKETQKAIAQVVEEIKTIDSDLKDACEFAGVDYFAVAECGSDRRAVEEITDDADVLSAWEALQSATQDKKDLGITLGKLNDTIEDLNYEKNKFLTATKGSGVRDRESNLAVNRVLQTIGLGADAIASIKPEEMDKINELSRAMGIYYKRIAANDEIIKNNGLTKTQVAKQMDVPAEESKERLSNAKASKARAMAGLQSIQDKIEDLKNAILARKEAGSAAGLTKGGVAAAAAAEPTKQKRYRAISRGSTADAEAAAKNAKRKAAKAAIKNIDLSDI